MAKTLFLSDIHLPDTPSQLHAGFRQFLEGPARSADAVYLLGDIFEYWIGDDVGLDRYADEIRDLRALTGHGVAVYLMHGNRDFMVGRSFSRESGVRLLRDPTPIRLGHLRVLLSHGDRWCTDDRGYQRWRRFSRNRAAQWLFLRLPVARRQAIAGDLRSHSRSDTRYRPESIMDVNADAVTRAFRHHGVDCIVHGHTHRPATHTQTTDGRTCQRIVLPDWAPERMAYVEHDGADFRTITLQTG